MAGAAAAAGVTGAVMAGSPAGAANGDPILIGDDTLVGTEETKLTTSFATGPAFTISNPAAGGAADAIHGDAGVGTGVIGTAVGGGGVKGTSTSGTGVNGISSTADGVRATSNTGNSLMVNPPSANTAGAHLNLIPGSIEGPPTAGLHAVGQYWVDLTGALYQCTSDGTPGAWVRQQSLVTLDAPFRIYDSRVGQTNPSGSPQGVLAFGAGARTINCTPTPNPTTGASLPGFTQAILFNMTLANTVGAVGSVVLWSAGVSEPTTASITWTGSGVVVGNAVTSACDDFQDVQIKCTTGSSTHVILDIIGFYR